MLEAVVSGVDFPRLAANGMTDRTCAVVDPRHCCRERPNAVQEMRNRNRELEVDVD
jgi:hypothetical protein